MTEDALLTSNYWTTVFYLLFKTDRYLPFYLPSSPCCSADPSSPTGSLGAPWLHVSKPVEHVVAPLPEGLPVPSITLTESASPSSPQPETGESCDGDYDDGPEYLAIGNLGQRARQDSQSSANSSERGETPNHSNNQKLQGLMSAVPRRSSFSEVQRGPAARARGHTRSFSDTGVNQKIRNGECLKQKK